MDEPRRTLLIEKKDGEEIQVDIPVSWHVTYGPAAAGIPKSDGRIPMALRIYETDKMQRAIFTDVVSFRDMSIPIRVKHQNVQEKDGFVEVEGIRKRTTFQAKTVEWRNPDEPRPELPRLNMPDDEEMFQNTTD